MSKKVLIGIPCLLKGGTEYQTLHMTRALVFLGYAVDVVCYFEKDENLIEEFERAGAKVHILNWERGRSAISIVFRLKELFKKFQPDVLHVQYVAPGALPIVAGKLAGIKKIFATVHQPYTLSHGRFSKVILRFASKLTDNFMAVSQSAEQSWFGSAALISNVEGVLPRHFTLYNTVNVGELKKIAEVPSNYSGFIESYPFAAGKTIIGTVSRMRYEKGIDLLIEAFYNVSIENQDLILLLIGDGPDIETLKEKVQTLKLESKVIFFGGADWLKAMKLMSVMNIVVVPSRFEGFGLTAAEAKAIGKPLIVADNFGLSEIVINNEDGLTFESGNASGLSKALELYLKNKQMAADYSKKGQVNAELLFDWPAFVDNIKKLYKSL